MPDYRYRCVGCNGEFTLHPEKELDPLEYDPACPWCEDTTGLPCYMTPQDAVEGQLVAFQEAMMQHLLDRRNERAMSTTEDGESLD